ncbi:MAG: TetR/AcrR family transcriptional regulator [Leifsonia sp.]
MNSDVRARSKEILRARLAHAAADYCALNGFAESTVDQIAQGIGISRATFFRYFASKEEAVVAAARLERESVDAHLRSQHPVPGTLAFDAVRSALGPTVDAVRADPARARAQIAMITGNAALRGQLASDRADESAKLATALASYISDPAMAEAVAAASMAATELGWRLWAADETSDLGDQFDRAFVLIGQAPSARFDRSASPAGS